MSAKQSAQSQVQTIEMNPLAMMERGLRPKTETPLHRKSAAVGNLYFEYVQNVAMLRGIVRSGRQVAEYLEYRGLIVWDRVTDRYSWKKDPLSKSEFLRMFQKPASLPQN